MQRDIIYPLFVSNMSLGALLANVILNAAAVVILLCFNICYANISELMIDSLIIYFNLQIWLS